MIWGSDLICAMCALFSFANNTLAGKHARSKLRRCLLGARAKSAPFVQLIKRKHAAFLHRPSTNANTHNLLRPDAHQWHDRLTLNRLATSAANACCGPPKPSSAPAPRGGSSPPAVLCISSSRDATRPLPMSTSLSGQAACRRLSVGAAGISGGERRRGIGMREVPSVTDAAFDRFKLGVATPSPRTGRVIYRRNVATSATR